MLTTAAVVTIVFKKLRIPTILGYIVAGFLIGPNFPLFMNIESAASVETWSEIGVVIILFHIGLEFDFHKLSEIGSTAVVSAAVKMGGVMLVGYGFGILAGMSTMNAVFLGAMLSISSTVVIQKCFSEMGLEGEKYTGLVMGSLVMEDVIAVFMMVVLTTISASQTSDGRSMALQMFLMITYLVLWLILGIFFLPTILDRTMGLMSDEMLTLLSLGFCFLMALLANALGFSMELGAFLAGTFFAGTKYVHRVEHVTAGIKDMFGSIFFLSVGMMDELTETLKKEYREDTPVAVVYKASWEDQKIVIGNLTNIARKVKEAGITKTALTVVGDFLGDEYELSKLYDKTFTHEFRKAKEEDRGQVWVYRLLVSVIRMRLWK